MQPKPWLHCLNRRKTNERNKSFQNSPACPEQQQAARIPHHAGHHHRCGFRHHDACHRTRFEEKHPGANFRNGFQHDHDSPGSRHAWRCPSRPQRHADPEADRLRSTAQRNQFLIRRQPQCLLQRTAHRGQQQLPLFRERCRYGLS